MIGRRVARVVFGAGGLVLVLAAPVLAQEDRKEDAEDAFVVMTGRLEVARDDTVGAAVIFNGPAVIDGTVEEDVLVFNGPTTITGTVTDEVFVFNGRVTVRSGAEIGGDLVSRQDPVIEEGATIGGEVRDISGFFRELPLFAGFISWIAVTVSALVLGLLLLLLAPRAADALADVWRTGLGPSIGWGVVLLVGLPIVAVLALVTIVGAPLGFGLLVALWPIYAIGYVAGAWVLGRLIVRQPRSRFLALLAGIVILRAVAFVPVLGGIAGLVATIVGLGTITVALYRSRQGEGAPAATAA